jgi:hypothetical protein
MCEMLAPVNEASEQTSKAMVAGARAKAPAKDDHARLRQRWDALAWLRGRRWRGLDQRPVGELARRGKRIPRQGRR